MEEESNRSIQALQRKENDDPKQLNEDEDDNRGEISEKNDERRRVSGHSSSDSAVENSSSRELKAPQSETLTSSKLSQGDFQSEFDESSHLLSEVPVGYSLEPLQSAEELKSQVRAVREESLGGTNGESAQAQIQHQLQIPNGPSKLELSPTSVTQSISSTPHPTLSEQKLQLIENRDNPCPTEQVNQTSPVRKPLSIVPTLKIPSDGYNWRKYGQKQVKSPEGSRSYYRCTFSDCDAKKIECCDRSNHLIETVYRSNHNHDPPPKVNCTRENRPTPPIVPVDEGTGTSHPGKGVSDPVPSALSNRSLKGVDQIPETKQESSGSDETTEINMEEYVNGPECRKRQKRNSADEPESHPKPGRKPKFIVHAAGDVGISGDGYRWRKYGQKMVKGNPHPRNYYRCTSAGCPVRKHVERAVDNMSALVITYKGVHDHDAPVPRKTGPKNALVVAAATVSSDSPKDNNNPPLKSQTQLSMDSGGELTGEAMNPSVEKTAELARPLLSIGFEIKPC